MQSLGKALVVLYSIGVGLQDVGVAVEFARGDGSILQQIVVVAIHAGDEVATQSLRVKRVHQHHLLPLRKRGLRGEHHLKVAFIVLVGRKDGAPESNVVIALHIGHNALASLLGSQAVGRVNVGRGQVITERSRHSEESTYLYISSFLPTPQDMSLTSVTASIHPSMMTAGEWVVRIS